MALLSDKITQKFPSLYKFKPGIEFLARLFLFGAFAILIKWLYGNFADLNGTLHLPLMGSVNLIEALRMTLLHISFFFLKAIEANAFLMGWVLGIQNKGGVRLETPCLGINVCLIFSCLVLAYPVSISTKKMLGFLSGGLIIIQSVNVIRIIGMVYVAANRYILPIEHHDLFNAVVYLIVIFMFYKYTTLDNVKVNPQLKSSAYAN